MVFWILALFLGAIASAFVLLPLISRRQGNEESRDAINIALFNERLADLDKMKVEGELGDEEYTRLVTEAKKDLLQDTELEQEAFNTETESRRLIWVLAALVPITAILIYGDFGLGRGSITDLELSDRLRNADFHDRTAYVALVEELALRLEAQPDNVDGQFLLAGAYRNLETFDKAVPVYAMLVAKFPGDSRLASLYAETMFLRDGRKMTAEVKAAVDHALKLDPDDLTMLEVQAIAAVEAGDSAGALSWFQRALATGVTGERAELIRTAMRKVREKAGEVMVDPGRGVNVLIEVAGEVEAAPGAVVFVFARAVGGPPAPLAARRMLRSDLPQLVRLDETMAMMPGMSLADFDEVQVVARISSTGAVAVHKDDYEARSGTIDLTRNNDVIKLTIRDRVNTQ